MLDIQHDNDRDCVKLYLVIILIHIFSGYLAVSVHSNVSRTTSVCQLQIDVGNCVAEAWTELQLFPVVLYSSKPVFHSA